MNLTRAVRGRHYSFASVKDVLNRAGEEKSGDRMAGLAARDARERVAAKQVLADLPLSALRENPSIPYERDEVTRLVEDQLDAEAYGIVRGFTVGELREWILDGRTTGEEVLRISPGLTPEMVSAVTKLMTNLDLMVAGAKVRVVVRCNSTLGLPGRVSSRVQANHPTDSVEGILAGVREGLSYGTGDAVLGINPATESVENCAAILRGLAGLMERYGIPTQACVLAHVRVQMEALRRGAPLDLMFQSIAGAEKANRHFGVDVALLKEAWAMTTELGRARGPNVMYFETGEGTALSADAHEGTDQLTMEARAYGLARHFQPFLVNSVVGFIGPEYLYDGKQILRAGLEDHFMGKLSGISMGCDDCYTNHAVADQNDHDTLAVCLVAAGVNYLMSLPMGDDVMLNYQSTSFHDNAALRELLRLRPTPEFEGWLVRMGLWEDGRLTGRAGDPTVLV
ncbi:ethanolamine ammonia-lyase subunit EutB [Myxococcota bacterium]|nr:ethanolamine ammonia-lyase subunit EutB [Myxococcota bacterium]